MSDKRSDAVRCERCGAKAKILASRVSALRQQSYTNFFRCEACGEISSQEVPHPPANRT